MCMRFGKELVYGQNQINKSVWLSERGLFVVWQEHCVVNVSFTYIYLSVYRRRVSIRLLQPCVC